MIKELIKQIKHFLYKYSIRDRRNYYMKLGCKIGENTRFTGPSTFGSEPYLIEIGNDCLIAGCTFHTHDGGVKVLNSLNYFQGKTMDKMGRIKVGNNCFLGLGSTIMGGVIIGDNCIIGAGSIVTKNVPSNSVVAGVPAKVICTIDDYYKNNVEKGDLYNTTGLSRDEKKKFLIENVKPLT